MKKTTLVLVSVLFFFVVCTSSLAATVYLDAVISFDQPTGSSTQGGPPTAALGAPDAAGSTGFVSIDVPETLVVAFIDNSALNGPGNDIRIYEYQDGDSEVDVYGSMNNLDYIYLGRPDGDVEYDIANYPGLDYINFVKFVGFDNGGSYAGFDLDAVEALNSGAHVPIPGAVWLFGSGLFCLVGLRRRRCK